MNPEAIKAAAQAWERARALQKSGRYREAEPHFREAILGMPNSAALLADYGRLAEQLEDWKAAAKIWTRVGEIDRTRQVDDRIGLALLQQGRNAEAVAPLERHARRHPDASDSTVNLAAAYSRLGRDAEAITVLREAVKHTPGFELAWESLVTLLVNTADAAGAAAALHEARTRFPESPELRYLEMDHRLKNREYGAGFDLFDARWGTRFFAGDIERPGEKRWDGEPFYGRLLVRAEQGIGDELLYSSLFHDLARAHFDNLIECDPRLLPLYRRSYPHLSFVSRYLKAGDPEKPAFDHDIMAGDLCRLFRRKDADFPAKAGWLAADPERVAALRRRDDAVAGNGLRVGISWRSAHPAFGDAKSMALRRMLPLLSTAGATFFNLQYGDTGQEIDALAADTGIRVVRDADIDPLRDLDSHAARIAALDLVVSTSNSAVHLAGALGVPTWLLLHRDRGLPWYWAYSGEQVPWYPHTRLMRCAKRGEWEPVVAEAAARLAARIADGRATAG